MRGSWVDATHALLRSVVWSGGFPDEGGQLQQRSGAALVAAHLRTPRSWVATAGQQGWGLAGSQGPGILMGDPGGFGDPDRAAAGRL